MFRISIFVIIGFSVSLFTQDTFCESQDSYRIETVMENFDTKEIRFISPDGNIVKVLQAWKDERKEWNEHTQRGIRYVSRVLVSKNCRYALRGEESVPVGGKFGTIKNTNIPLKLTYFNAEGKVLWKKEFTVWYIGPGGEDYGYKVSHNGEAVLFLRSKRLGYDEFETEFYVFDTLGSEVIKVTYNSLVEGRSQISPDGKLIAAQVSKDRKGNIGEYLFFLDVETGKTKVVKAEGEGWRVAGFPLSDGKIEFTLFQYPKSIILSFNEIPNDLSVLFDKEESKEQSKIELIPIYEKTFEDTIVDVIFDTATVSIKEAKKTGWKDKVFTEGEKNRGKALIYFPKMVFVSRGKRRSIYIPHNKRNSCFVKEIKFYGKAGRLQNRLEIGKKDPELINTSPQNKYFLVSKLPGEYELEFIGGTLYDCDGRKVCVIRGSTPLAVSDEGYIISADRDEIDPPGIGGDFFIYSPEGNLIKTIENPDKRKVGPFFAMYTRDSEYALLIFTGLGGYNIIIYFIEKSGEILWKRDFPQYEFSGYGNEIDLISKVGIIAIFDLIKVLPSGEKDWKVFAFHIDMQGNTKWKIPLEIRGNMIVNIAENMKRVYIVSGVGYIWCLDINTEKIFWKHKELWSPDPGEHFPRDVPIFSEIRIINTTLYINGKNRQNLSSTLFAFDTETGELLKKIEYPQEEIMFVESARNVSLINTAKGRVSILKKVLK